MLCHRKHYLSFSPLFLFSPFHFLVYYYPCANRSQEEPSSAHYPCLQLWPWDLDLWTETVSKNLMKREEEEEKRELFVINLVGLFCGSKSSTIKLCTATSGWHVASPVYWLAEHTSSCMDLVSPIWNSGLVCPCWAFTYSHHCFYYGANGNRLSYMIKQRQTVQWEQSNKKQRNMQKHSTRYSHLFYQQNNAAAKLEAVQPIRLLDRIIIILDTPN